MIFWKINLIQCYFWHSFAQYVLCNICLDKPQIYLTNWESGGFYKLDGLQDFGKPLETYYSNKIMEFTIECISRHPVEIEVNMKQPSIFENVTFERYPEKTINAATNYDCYKIRFTVPRVLWTDGLHNKYSCRSLCSECNDYAEVLILINTSADYPLLDAGTKVAVDVTPDENGHISFPCYVTQSNICPNLYAITYNPPNNTKIICRVRPPFETMYDCIPANCSFTEYSFAHGFKLSSTLFSRGYMNLLANIQDLEFGCEVFLTPQPNRLPYSYNRLTYQVIRQPLGGAYFKANPSNFILGYNDYSRNYTIYGTEVMNLSCESNHPIDFHYDRQFSFPGLKLIFTENNGFYKYKAELTGQIFKQRAKAASNPFLFTNFDPDISCVTEDTGDELFRWIYDHHLDIRQTGIFFQIDNFAIECRMISSVDLYIVKCSDRLNCQVIQKYAHQLKKGPMSMFKIHAANYITGWPACNFGDLAGRCVTKEEIKGIEHGVVLCYGGNGDILTKEFIQLHHEGLIVDISNTLPIHAGMNIDITPRYIDQYYVNQTIIVSCSAISALYMSPLKIKITSNSNSSVDLEHTAHKKIYNGSMQISATYTIPSSNIRSVACCAQHLYSTKWEEFPKPVTIIEGTKPEVYLTSEDLIVPLGTENITLSCIVSGDPTPSILFYKDKNVIATKGELFEDISRNQTVVTLRLNPIQQMHVGTYSCEASNFKGTTTSKISLQLEITSTLWMALLATGIVSFALLILLYYFVKQSKKIRQLTEAEIEEFEKGIGDIWALTKDEINSSAHAIPYNSSYELPRENWVTDKGKILGQGAYGIVSTGYLKRGDHELLVAIKTAKQASTNLEAFRSLLSELKLMAYIGHHEHIVALVAACTSNIRNREVFLALEYCSEGNLLEALHKARPSFQNLYVDTLGETYLEAPEVRGVPNTENVDSTQLLAWSIHIAKGMEFLGSKKIVHGDLAARNVLLNGKLAKVGDFGLSRHLNEYAVYVKKSRALLPWKWMAIESLTENLYTEKSDVWSFGVTLWEIFTLGKAPYPGLTWNDEFLLNLKNGKRFPQPNYASRDIYDKVILPTMATNRNSRPAFTDLIETLNTLKVNTDYDMSGFSAIVG